MVQYLMFVKLLVIFLVTLPDQVSHQVEAL